MSEATIPDLETRLAGAVEALRIADERAIAGRLPWKSFTRSEVPSNPWAT
jgi:hypothetical protein